MLSEVILISRLCNHFNLILLRWSAGILFYETVKKKRCFLKKEPANQREIAKKDRGLNPIIKYSDTTRMEYSFGFMFVGFLLVTGSASPIEHDYCVIGAGPAGLQIGYFLHKAHRNYVILEKSSSAGRIILI